MGLLSQISTALGVSRKQFNILMVGLDNSGKSTIVNQMKATDVQATQVAPTIGYTNDKFVYNNTTFSVCDMSGQGKYRNLWETFYKEIDGVAFVVDSSDRLRLAVARDELWLLLDHKEFAPRKVPLLVLANKMDEKGSLTTSEVSQCLGLDLIRSRNWHICASCAVTGQGLDDGFDWLAQNIRDYLDSRK